MPMHQLSGLTEDDCWSLFKERAFRREAEERPNLVALGKEIVKKCGGVPLALKSSGSMMSNKSEENQWISVVKSELWNLPQHENELKDLNLGGALLIKHLQRVEIPRDAKEANLVGKPNLLRLSLSRNKDDSDLQSQEDVEKVLEALKPHANLKQLDIFGYKGAKFSSWMMDNILCNVVHIELSDCDKCSKLPPLALLPCLRTLHLENMSQFGEVFKRGWKGAATMSCPKLTLPHLPSVEQLTVEGCNEVILGSILGVLGNDELNYLPDGMLLNLTSLKTLEVNYFRKLKCLPTEIVSLTSLETLDIWSCSELESFPEQGMEGLKCLKYLSLGYCPRFKALTEGLQHLSCLETLSLHGCPELVALPDGMKYLSSLRNLTLRGGFGDSSWKSCLMRCGMSSLCNPCQYPTTQI
ncbi:hypothetical protein Ddye_032377 [Dipteronia dyeriana]|uniref:NB-ARC domain-containing protein n=1 Tax=Dipteronia dyeriana TaxID=168575 RepID=A0AAD9TL98_9ROSI|nr:hypothetical protein Ddye_032377 [Dipteronia dyeriana]